MSLRELVSGGILIYSTLGLDVLMTARPGLAKGLPLRLMWLAAVVGEGESGPRHLVENLMVCDALALGLQDSKSLAWFMKICRCCLYGM